MMPSIDELMRSYPTGAPNSNAQHDQKMYARQARYIWDLQYRLDRIDKSKGELFKSKRLSLQDELKSKGLRAKTHAGITLTGMQISELIQYGEFLLSNP